MRGPSFCPAGDSRRKGNDRCSAARGTPELVTSVTNAREPLGGNRQATKRRRLALSPSFNNDLTIFGDGTIY